MNEMKAMVQEFHEAFGVPVNLTPQCSIGKNRALLRAKLIFEEARESIHGMACFLNYWHDGVNGECEVAQGGNLSIEEIADGLADLLYVTFGACLEFGIPIEEVFKEVHRSNLSKLWKTSELCEIKDGDWTVDQISAIDSERQVIVKDGFGKVRKSPSYSPANISKIIQEWEKK